MHGGSAGSGAPLGNKNAVKHGAFTKVALQRRAETRELYREVRKLLKELTKPEPKCAKAEGQPTLGGQDHDRAQVKAREANWAARRSGYGSAQAGHTRLSRTYCFATHEVPCSVRPLLALTCFFGI